MRLLTFELLKVHSGRLWYCICKRRISSIANKSTFNLNTPPQTFRYQYGVNELLENLSVSTKRIWSSFDFRLKDLLESNSEYRSITSSVILAAKYGLLGNLIEENTCQVFFDHLSANIKEMTAEDVVSTLIALNYLNVPLSHPINRELTVRVTHMLKGEYKNHDMNATKKEKIMKFF